MQVMYVQWKTGSQLQNLRLFSFSCIGANVFREADKLDGSVKKYTSTAGTNSTTFSKY